MKPSLAGVVILYNPDDSVLNNIRSYASYLDILYIIDNSTTNNKNLIEKLQENLSIKYIPHHENKGIAYSLNEVLDLVKGRYEWLLTMEQDSSFYSGKFPEYTSILSQIGSDVYGICPNHESLEIAGRGKTLVRIDRCITSGSIIRVNLALTCGGFDENLFIDEVDFEFNYRCEKRGYKLLQYCPRILLHHVGHPIYVNIFGWHFKTLNENAIRQYYIFRNKLYIASNYPEKRWFYYIDLLKWFIKIILAEPDKWKKIKYGFLGCYDFYRNQYGKIPASYL